MALSILNLNYGQVIQRICRMVGHPIPADPAGSTDQAVQQMGEAVNVALGELLTMHEWQDLTELMTISIVADSSGQVEKEFDLPADFYRFVDQTQWAEQTMWPAAGPVSPQVWQLYRVRSVSPEMMLYWQIRKDKLWVLGPPYPDPIDFEAYYISSAQVIDATTPTLYKNTAIVNGDTFKLDSYLITLLARARYLEWKGFDSSAATRDFLAVFNSRAGADKGAPTLSISGRRGAPLITVANVPPTGYGT